MATPSKHTTQSLPPPPQKQTGPTVTCGRVGDSAVPCPCRRLCVDMTGLGCGPQDVIGTVLLVQELRLGVLQTENTVHKLYINVYLFTKCYLQLSSCEQFNY